MGIPESAYPNVIPNHVLGLGRFFGSWGLYPCPSRWFEFFLSLCLSTRFLRMTFAVLGMNPSILKKHLGNPSDGWNILFPWYHLHPHYLNVYLFDRFNLGDMFRKWNSPNSSSSSSPKCLSIRSFPFNPRETMVVVRCFSTTPIKQPLKKIISSIQVM